MIPNEQKRKNFEEYLQIVRNLPKTKFKDNRTSEKTNKTQGFQMNCPKCGNGMLNYFPAEMFEHCEGCVIWYSRRSWQSFEKHKFHYKGRNFLLPELKRFLKLEAFE